MKFVSMASLTLGKSYGIECETLKFGGTIVLLELKELLKSSGKAVGVWKF